MPCYYCGNTFVDGDKVVPLPILTARQQDHGGIIFQDHDNVEYVHQTCLGSPP